MKVWLIKTGEPVPFLQEGFGVRAMRTGQIARYLSAQGHDVTWWSSGFDHLSKEQMAGERNVPVIVGPNLNVILLSSSGYKRNISLQRARDHRELKQGFEQLSASLPAPDVILCSYPTIDFADAAVAYGKAHNVPVILDVRDLWPDIIEERLTYLSRGFLPNALSRFALRSYRRKAKAALAEADSVTSISNGMLQWAQDLGARTNNQRERDRVFHQSKPAPSENSNDAEISEYLNNRPVAEDGGARIRLVWSGSVIPGTDADALFEALSRQTPQMQAMLDIVICGRGSLAKKIRNLENRIENLTYFTWLNSDALNHLLNTSHVGLMCYLDRKDFQMSIPNKVVDYLAASLRILTNLTGEIVHITQNTDILLPYTTGSADSLLSVFEEISTHPDRFRSLPETARTLFFDKFENSSVMKELESHMYKLAGGNL